MACPPRDFGIPRRGTYRRRSVGPRARGGVALAECVLAVVLLAHAAGAFVYTRQRLAFNWVAVSSVALVSSLCLTSALGGLMGGLYPVVLVGAIATLGSRFPRAWASFYLGGLGGCVAACVATVPDHDPFVGLFVVVPSLVYILIGALGRR